MRISFFILLISAAAAESTANAPEGITEALSIRPAQNRDVQLLDCFEDVFAMMIVDKRVVSGKFEQLDIFVRGCEN
jgi:hypothetical protein